MVSEMLNENPDWPEALYMAGVILRGQNHYGMALAVLRRALALEQKQPNLWSYYAACLHDCHKYDEAREAHLLIHKMLPNSPVPLASIAAGYTQQGKGREAVEWADKALAIDPKSVSGNVAKAFGCLSLGRWKDGWAHVDYLYGEQVTVRVYRDPPEPVWDGSKGKVVVVQADQGIGDILMFAQCLPDAAKDCKKLIVETSSRLAPLIRRNFPMVTVYDTIKEKANVSWPDEEGVEARVHISLLPRFYRKDDSEFPRRPYLTADPAKRAYWRAWLKQFPKPWVGIAWKGGIPRTNNLARSMDLADLEPILSQGGSFISLAYQEVNLEVAHWNIDHPQQVIMPQIDNEEDYEEWLALIAELDHVVTVTTSVAHVCGALGRKAWVMVNSVPAWRYVYRPSDGGMIWYPRNTLDLYRQTPGEKDWSHCIARVAKDYGAFILPRFK